MPSTRRGDPFTSRLAADSVREVNKKQRDVLDTFIRHGRMTDSDLLRVYDGEPQSPSGLRTRRRELTDKGLLRAEGTTVNDKGRRTIVWGARERSEQGSLM